MCIGAQPFKMRMRPDTRRKKYVWLIARLHKSYVKLTMMIALLLLVPLLVDEVYCQQTFPYVSFMGETLADHSYVDISQVGYDFTGGSNIVHCHTDLDTCCSAAQGLHRGDWYFPNGNRLPFPGSVSPIVEFRQDQRVELRRTTSSAMVPTGLYYCDIAVHSNGMRETVYVGLYASNGGKVYYGLPIV